MFWFKCWFGLIAALVVACFVYAIWSWSTCKRWERVPDTTTCWGSRGFMTCEPAKECVAR